MILAVLFGCEPSPVQAPETKQIPIPSPPPSVPLLRRSVPKVAPEPLPTVDEQLGAIRDQLYARQRYLEHQTEQPQQ